MLRMLNVILLGIGSLLLLACGKPVNNNTSETPDTTPAKQEVATTTVEPKNDSQAPLEAVLPTLPASAFKTVEWVDLMPKEDLDALLNPPSYVTDVEDGSFEDQISSQIQNTLAAAGDDRYQQALSLSLIHI